jgi:hypothetical protein
MDSMSASQVAVRELFVHTARVVRDAVADDAVGRAWNSPSVLEDQLVGGLAGHLARGGVWVVDDYLSAEVPDAPFVSSAAEYFVEADRALNEEGHRQIRERGAQVAAQGHEEVSKMLAARLSALIARLVTEPPDRRVGVAGGALTMLLDEYLKSRIVEQVVHLDDLARSIDREPWPVSFEAQDLVIHIGADIGRIRSGATEMIRCLYRTKLDPTLPVV